MKLATENENQLFMEFMDKKNTIKRVIFINKISDISLNNIGCHWTSNMSYTHTGGGQNGFSKGLYQASIYTTKKGVNKDATKISREEYPHEKEIVLLQNTELELIYIVIVPIIDGKTDYKNRQLYVSSGNSGERVDKWVLSI